MDNSCQALVLPLIFMNPKNQCEVMKAIFLAGLLAFNLRQIICLSVLLSFFKRASLNLDLLQVFVFLIPPNLTYMECRYESI